jgi:hypothetical protein
VTIQNKGAKIFLINSISKIIFKVCILFISIFDLVIEKIGNDSLAYNTSFYDFRGEKN